jgi:hypothetical protein
MLLARADERRDRHAMQLLDQFGPARCVVAERGASLRGQYHDIQAVLRHVDTAERMRLSFGVQF